MPMQTDQPSLAKFPLCKHYIEEFLSDEQQFKSKYFHIYTAFVRACRIELTKEQAVRALIRISEVFKRNDGPVVVIKKLAPGTGGEFSGGAGGWQFSERIFIYISEKMADAYEHGNGWMNLEGALLHESVHWVRFNSGNGDDEGGDWNTLNFRMVDAGEIGELFELWAYGFSICQQGENGKLVQYGPPGSLPTVKPR
jgi:zincin-like metallopeptidase toxin 3 of polymorphic toxin system